jgi:hypothetical protein
VTEPTVSAGADDQAAQLHDTLEGVKATLHWSQERYKHGCKGSSPPEFQPGDKVWLLSPNIKPQRPNKKLDHTR